MKKETWFHLCRSARHVQDTQPKHPHFRQRPDQKRQACLRVTLIFDYIDEQETSDS